MAWASKEFAAEQGSNTPFSRTPEICVEIASPSNTKQEIEAKVQAFLAAGAREVWVAQAPGQLAYFGGAGTLERSGYPVAIELPKEKPRLVI